MRNSEKIQKEEKVKIPTAKKFDYLNNGVTVSLMLYTVNQKADGTSPVNWRIAYRGKRKMFQTGLFYTLSEWKEFCDKGLLKHTDTKNDLKSFQDNVLIQSIKELIQDNCFSLDALIRDIAGGNKDSLTDAFKARISELRSANNIGNADLYQTSYNALQRFAHYKSLRGRNRIEFLQRCIDDRNVTRGENKITVKDRDILFTDITPKFIKECEQFWIETGVSKSTISMRMRNIRTIINNDGKPILKGAAYPFGRATGKYKIPTGTRKNVFLPIEDIWKIENYETDHQSLILARDMFIFMFYGSGMNFKDLSLLKYSDITFDKELLFYREKVTTADDPQPIFVPLTPPLVEIIARQGNKDQSGYIFPFLNGVKDGEETKIKKITRKELDLINANLKIIATDLGINTDITTNWARHSYISHLANEEMLNDTTIKRMVGHSTKSSVIAGYNHLNPKKRREINSKLLNPKKQYNVIGAVKVSI